ncbi:MAG: M36 family metallopeptidase, partial [Actinomycetota bacterium]
MPRKAILFTALLTLGTLPPADASADNESLSEPAQMAIEHLGVDPGTVRVTDEYTSDHNGVTHVYLRQVVDGVDVAGADATVSVQTRCVVTRGRTRSCKRFVVHSGSRFIDPDEASGSQELSAGVAERVALASTRSTDSQVVARPELLYRVLDDGSIRLVWDVQVETPRHWWNLSIDAENGRLVHRFDYVDSENQGAITARTARQEDSAAVQDMVDAFGPPQQALDGSSYVVFGVPLESPNDGNRVTVHNPADATASPFGWHDTNGEPGPESTLTTGNNVDAYADTLNRDQADPGSRPDGGPGLDFNHLLPTYDATPAIYRDAAVDNLFYGNNVIHDITSGYGFNEEAGNFQTTNYTGQGKAGDHVLAEAQDGEFVLNANFSTPPDGQSGRMQMFLWVDAFDTLGLGPEDIVRPYSHQVRDGDLDNGVIFHEYG